MGSFGSTFRWWLVACSLTANLFAKALTPFATVTSGASIHFAGFGRRAKGGSRSSREYVSGVGGTGPGFGASACAAITTATSSAIIPAIWCAVHPESLGIGNSEVALGVLRDETPGVGFGFDESVGFKDVSLPTSGTKLPCLSRRNPSHTIPRWYTPLRGFWVEAGIVVCVEWQPVSHSQSQAVTGSHVRSASHFTSAVARGTCQIHKSQIILVGFRFECVSQRRPAWLSLSSRDIKIGLATSPSNSNALCTRQRARELSRGAWVCARGSADRM